MAKYKIIPSSRTIVQSPISIGHKAEKGVEAIEFDLTAWVETYGSGTLTVIMRRWGDAIPYPIALEIDEDNKATWTLSDTDTAKAGMAYAQLSYIVGDEVVKKSDIYTFRVMDSLTGEGEPPEAYESWLEHLTHFAAEAMAEVLDIEGIVTDKTLTVDGGIADAKATGDALALKADKSTTYTKTEVDQMIEDVEVETDTTLEVAGAAADAAETGRQIGLIKADLNAMEGLTNDIKEALIACFDNVAWANERGDASYESLKNALGIVYKYDLSLSNGLVEKHVGGISANSNHSMCLDNGVNRRTYTYSEGVIPFFDKETDTPLNVYPIPVPPDAVSVTITITPNTQYFFAATRKLASDRTDYSGVSESISYTAGSGTINIARDGERKYLFILSKYNSAGSSYPTEPTDLRIVFHKEGE